ncbi:G-type lectin S-receptor-like serine/threonine-protein kinase RKS1 [Bidens hawaiensis]|uniref:G-type lectin S-receptor-like serine/threonine-protein kinase RKS1 n=1 Tax=Bidens hawaiensis TaxID=980011 RepID=UPI00404A598B
MLKQIIKSKLLRTYTIFNSSSLPLSSASTCHHRRPPPDPLSAQKLEQIGMSRPTSTTANELQITNENRNHVSKRCILVCVIIFLIFRSCSCIDTITLTRPLKDGDILVSNEETFALGFFSPANSTDRYVGIWYNKVSEKTVVWVANRDRPITNSSGILSIDETGNLALQVKDQSFVFWSTNVSGVVNNVSSAQLLDSGNLVLFQGLNKEVYIWKSFDHPSNTILPGMKIGVDKRTGLNRVFTSWKSSGNPGFGDYSHKMELVGSPQLFLFQGKTKVWRTGSWTGHGWSGIPEMSANYLFNVTYTNNDEEVTIVYQMINSSIFSRLVVTESRTMDRLTWQEADHKWVNYWSAPKDQCDGYNHCGPFGLCDPFRLGAFECECFPGYEPQSPQGWDLRDGSKGCKIKAGTQICEAGDGFAELAHVKVPDTSTARVNMSLGLKVCEDLCLRNCTCVGYALADTSKGAEGGGCITWYGDMIDTRTFSDGGQSFYIRVDAAELAMYSSKRRNRSNKNRFLIIGMPMIIAGFLILSAFICCYVRKKKAKQDEGKVGFSFMNSLKSLEGSMEKDIGKNVDLDVFDFSTIVAATDNFSHSSKLGEGGFGSVYKGKLLNGLEIAVKRLSQSSGQGMQEFKNEVMLIAKLQHRNLVRLLGYCFCKEEKMLVYENLPNKGLDSFIFDQEKASLLDWKKRYQIIRGIVRGLLYLHHDSRLRIIHRDLKASNVLLDADLNPKISDFGMAKIFGGDEGEAKTRRVVGTYGYMSPEYAMQGLFSVKSDVYSFGILVLEIISGRKNNSYYKEDTVINLTRHVWDLWKQGNVLQVVDPSLGDSFDAREVLLCIHISILCVQELPADRPTMTEVATMLSSHETKLPSPSQPAFIFGQSNRQNSTLASTSGGGSVDDETITIPHPR